MKPPAIPKPNGLGRPSVLAAFLLLSALVLAPAVSRSQSRFAPLREAAAVQPDSVARALDSLLALPGPAYSQAELDDLEEALVTVLQARQRNAELLLLVQRMKARHLANGDSAALAKDLYRSAMACFLLSQYARSQADALETIKVGKALGDSTNMARGHMVLGLCLKAMKQYESSIEHCHASIDIARQIGDDQLVAYNANTLGSIHKRLGQQELSLEQYQSSLAIKLRQEDWSGCANSYGNIGQTYLDLLQLDSAQHYSSLALQMAERSGRILTKTQALTDLANIHRLRGDIGQAERLAQEAIRLAEQIQHPQSLAWALKVLADIKRAKGEHEEAFELLLRHSLINDSSFTLEQAEAISQAEALYTLSEQQAENELLRAENELKDLRASQQRRLMALGALLFASVVLALALLFRQKLRYARQLERRVEERTQALRQEMELRGQSERKYRTIAENTSDGILSLDAGGRVSYLSPALERMAGLAEAEALGKRPDQTRPPLADARWLAALDEARGQARPNITLEIRLEMPDGSVLWREDVATFLREADGTPAGIQVVCRDIRQRKADQETILKLSIAAENAKIGIVITDRDARVRHANPHYLRMSGFEAREALGGELELVRGSFNPPALRQELLECLRLGKSWEGELQNLRQDGGRYWEHAILSPIPEPGQPLASAFVAVLTDISQQKKMLEELVLAKEKAEESDQLKTSFFKNVSHEVRTPMNAILGFTQVLEHDLAVPARTRKYLSIIAQSTRKLLDIVESMVLIAKLETGQATLHPSRFTVGPLFEGLFDELEAKRSRAGKPQVELRRLPSDLRATLETDQDYLRQILDILLDNALKFTERGHISLGFETQGQTCAFTVSDTGIGFSPDKKASAFKTFSKVYDQSKVLYGGLGLGLSICAGLARLLGGQVSVESQEGQGASFRVCLPLSLSAPPLGALPPEHGEAPLAQARLATLLVADDEPNNHIYLEEILGHSEGLRLLQALDGRQALRLALENEVDMVLMDLKMPEMDGFEALRQIKALKNGLPIVAQTAFSFSRESCLAAGFDGFLAKPYNQRQLDQCLRQHLPKLFAPE